MTGRTVAPFSEVDRRSDAARPAAGVAQGEKLPTFEGDGRPTVKPSAMSDTSGVIGGEVLPDGWTAGGEPLTFFQQLRG